MQLFSVMFPPDTVIPATSSVHMSSSYGMCQKREGLRTWVRDAACRSNAVKLETGTSRLPESDQPGSGQLHEGILTWLDIEQPSTYVAADHRHCSTVQRMSLDDDPKRSSDLEHTVQNSTQLSAMVANFISLLGHSIPIGLPRQHYVIVFGLCDIDAYEHDHWHRGCHPLLMSVSHCIVEQYSAVSIELLLSATTGVNTGTGDTDVKACQHGVSMAVEQRTREWHLVLYCRDTVASCMWAITFGRSSPPS